MLAIYHFMIRKLNCVCFIVTCVLLIILSTELYEFLKPIIIEMHISLVIIISFVITLLYLIFTLSAAKTVSDFVLYLTRNVRN